ncbi:MAG: LPS export ABC transporter ATP-binding protein [Candidatus Margulisiibacteriota bacterium]
MLETQKLIKIYGQKIVVNEVSINVNPGEIVGLLGPNGAGKTTTFYMTVGLVPPNGGSVYLNGEDITRLPMYKRARKGIGYLPQEVSIFRKLTVEENILVLWELMPSIPKNEYKQRLDTLLDEFKISHIRKQKGSELSGGEKRRVEIARALALEPSFLLLDEPFAGIDPITVTDIQGIIRYLKQKGLGLLITDHNVRETLSITDRAYLVHQGKLLISGNSKKIAEDPEAKKIYLGEAFTM